METVVLSLLTDHHVEARDGAGDHKVDEAHEVPYEEDHEHHTIQERGCLNVVAVIGITVKHIVPMIKPNDHCPVGNCKSPYIVI